MFARAAAPHRAGRPLLHSLQIPQLGTKVSTT